MVPSQPPNRCTQSHATWWSSAGCPLGPMTSEQMGHCCHTQVLWGKCLHCGLSCSSWLPPLPARKQPANLLPFPGRPFLQIWLYCQGPALRRCSVHFVGHSKHHLPKTKEMTLQMDITRWSIPKSDWLYSLQPNFIQTLGIPYPVTAIHKIQSRKSPCTSVNDMYFIDVWEILK